jgi:hypothetical protein
MGRCRLVVAAGVVWMAGSAAIASAQAPAPDGWVVLPIDEYRALRNRTIDSSPPVPPPPVEATITRIDYELAVDGESVAGRAMLTIDVLRDGWTRVQLPSGLMVRAARLDGQPVSMVEGPPPHVLLSRAGRFALALEFDLALVSSAGTDSITLPASPAPIVRAVLVLPRSGVDLTSAGGFVAEHTETPAVSRWTTFGRPHQALRLSWKRKLDDRRAQLPLRVRARLVQFVGLGEDACQVVTAVRVEVVQGLAREVALTLPPGLVVSEVNGPTVGDWDAVGGTLRVRLLEGTTSEVSFVVQGESRVPREGSVAVPLLRMPSAERETGGVAVDVLGAGEIAERLARGFDPADPSELGDVVTTRESPSMAAFRLRPLTGADARSLTVTVVRYAPQAVLIANVEEARYRALASEDGRLLVEARYAVRNNQRAFLKVVLPPGASVWSAALSGRPIRPGLAEQAGLLLPLEKGRAGEDAPTFVVELVYLQRIGEWVGKGRATLELPALDLPVSRTGVSLHYSPRFRLDLQPGTFREEQDPGAFAEALRRAGHADRGVGAGSGSVTGSGRGSGLGGGTAGAAESSRPGPAPAPIDPAAGLQVLVDRFRNESGGRAITGTLPVTVAFPELGPSIFLASELTAEARAPSFEVAFRRLRD